MKRLYKLVTIQDGPGGYVIHLDGKPVRTPMKNTLITTSRILATALMEEWAVQGQKIDVPSMRLTQILSTKIDRVATERVAMTGMLMEFLDTDLVCYRAPDPKALVAAQMQVWDPWLEWFAKTFGCALATTTGLDALRQPAAAHAVLKNYIDALNDDDFTILQIAVPATGSLVLGLAFITRKAGAQDLFSAARVEENHKAGIYNEALHGPDPAQEKKDCALMADLVAAQKFLELLREV